jgi:hypothetical protein
MRPGAQQTAPKTACPRGAHQTLCEYLSRSRKPSPIRTVPSAPEFRRVSASALAGYTAGQELGHRPHLAPKVRYCIELPSHYSPNPTCRRRARGRLSAIGRLFVTIVTQFARAIRPGGVDLSWTRPIDLSAADDPRRAKCLGQGQEISGLVCFFSKGR